MFVLIGIDRALKIFMPPLLADGKVVDLVPGFLQLRYVENTGAAFGFLKNSTALLSVLTAIVLVVLIYFFLFRSKTSNFLRYTLVLLIAGGLGNLFDRIVYGFVVDYFEFTFVRFAVFNAADCYITVGVIMLMIYVLFIDGRKEPKAQFAEADDDIDWPESESAGESDLPDDFDEAEFGDAAFGGEDQAERD